MESSPCPVPVVGSGTNLDRISAMAAGGQGMDPAVVDDVIGRLVEVRSGRTGKQAQLSESEIRQLCLASRDIFLAQPNLLELQAPLKICG